MSEATHDLLRRALDNFDLHDSLMTTSWAATYVGVDTSTIRHWKRRGYLHPVEETDDFGRPLYRPIDVLRAQARAAQNARRTRTSNLATRRADPAP